MTIKYWLGLYAVLIRSSVRSGMQYKFNFILGTILAALVQFAEFLMIAIVLNKFGAIKGWSLHEVGYLFAVMTLSKTLYRMLANDVHHLEKYLTTGELDQLLTRPVPILLALMSQNFRLMPAELLQGSTILFWSLHGLHASGQITWIALPYTLLAIVAGSVILFSIGLATAAVGFWMTRINELQTLTEDSAQTAARYPLAIYPAWLRSILLIVIPVGFVNYVPSLFILRGEYGPWLMPALALVAGIVFCLAMKFWKFGLSRYQSTGS